MPEHAASSGGKRYTVLHSCSFQTWALFRGFLLEQGGQVGQKRRELKFDLLLFHTVECLMVVTRFFVYPSIDLQH